jgi:type I site-specific restriction-modification system R (restriction) subunit
LKINSNKFGFSFFLSDKIKVNDLDQAAKQHGGATHNKDTGEIFSNIPGSEFIDIKEGELNTLSVYIPDTMSINEEMSKEAHQAIVYQIVHKIYDKYGSKGITPMYEKGLGTWYSEELHQVVYDNIIIASVHLERVTQADIKFFCSLARFIKRQMRQEAVTVAINTAMGLV